MYCSLFKLYKRSHRSASTAVYKPYKPKVDEGRTGYEVDRVQCCVYESQERSSGVYKGCREPCWPH